MRNASSKPRVSRTRILLGSVPVAVRAGAAAALAELRRHGERRLYDPTNVTKLSDYARSEEWAVFPRRLIVSHFWMFYACGVFAVILLAIARLLFGQSQAITDACLPWEGPLWEGRPQFRCVDTPPKPPSTTPPPIRL